MIENAVGITGLGSVGGPYKTRAKHHSPMFGWKIQSFPALQVMEAVFPHMSIRRQKRIREVIDQTS